MSLGEDVEVIRDRAVKSLDEAHDYFTYTRDAWRSIQRDVTQDGRKLSWQNTSTKSQITEKDVLSRAQQYVSVELPSSSLQQFVSIFENFFFDIAKQWVLAHPERLATRQLSGRVILGLRDKISIVNALVEKELQDVFYDRPVNWFLYFRGLTKIDAPTLAEAGQFAEIKATRDVLVHGQGVANSYYVDKAGEFARARPGALLEVQGPYHQKSWELIRKLTVEIGTQMVERA